MMFYSPPASKVLDFSKELLNILGWRTITISALNPITCPKCKAKC